MPNYKNLECLLAGSSSARRYFLSLPVPLQLRLHANSAAIQTAHSLHQAARILEHRALFEK